MPRKWIKVHLVCISYTWLGLLHIVYWIKIHTPGYSTSSTSLQNSVAIDSFWMKPMGHGGSSSFSSSSSSNFKCSCWTSILCGSTRKSLPSYVSGFAPIRPVFFSNSLSNSDAPVGSDSYCGLFEDSFFRQNVLLGSCSEVYSAESRLNILANQRADQNEHGDSNKIHQNAFSVFGLVQFWAAWSISKTINSLGT